MIEGGGGGGGGGGMVLSRTVLFRNLSQQIWQVLYLSIDELILGDTSYLVKIMRAIVLV